MCYGPRSCKPTYFRFHLSRGTRDRPLEGVDVNHFRLAASLSQGHDLLECVRNVVCLSLFRTDMNVSCGVACCASVVIIRQLGSRSAVISQGSNPTRLVRRWISAGLSTMLRDKLVNITTDGWTFILNGSRTVEAGSSSLILHQGLGYDHRRRPCPRD